MSAEVLPHWEGEMRLMVPHFLVATLEEGQTAEGLLGDAPGLAGPGTRAPGLRKRQHNWETQRNQRKCDSELLRESHSGLLKSPGHCRPTEMGGHDD